MYTFFQALKKKPSEVDKQITIGRLNEQRLFVYEPYILIKGKGKKNCKSVVKSTVSRNLSS